MGPGVKMESIREVRKGVGAGGGDDILGWWVGTGGVGCLVGW